MSIAVLPLNAGPNASPALARQIANFAAEIVRSNLGVEANAISYLIQLEGPQSRLAYVNASEGQNEDQLVEQMFTQTEADFVFDGLLTVAEDGIKTVVARGFRKGDTTPIGTVDVTFTDADSLGAFRKVIELLAGLGGQTLPAEMAENANLFGTENGVAFLEFLEGYDALQYVEKTQGQVANEFSPEPAMESLVKAVEADADWEAPYISLVQLSRLCTQHQVGTAELIERFLNTLVEKFPEDGRALFALGELFQATGDQTRAAETFEKAHVKEPTEPAILTRLGLAQMQMGMPVNAERNFRKAIDLEGDDKPSLDYLAMVLSQTGRAHEVPGLWKDRVASNPQDPQARVKYAVSQFQAGSQDAGFKSFEDALEQLEDDDAKLVVKRYYAPALLQKGEMDRAMDFYEDCIDVAPTDVPLLVEYAQTLEQADRAFEVPKILRDILAANPDQNTRAQVNARLIELEQPKRVEAVQGAQQKMEAEDFAGAAKDLRGLKTWLGDYWKMWLLLASALNRTEEFAEAEEAARQLINMFPGCEPAYGEVATALTGLNREDEAYNALRFGTSQLPNSLPIVINLALAAKRLGRVDEARGLARQIRESIGSNPDLDPILDDLER